MDNPACNNHGGWCWNNIFNFDTKSMICLQDIIELDEAIHLMGEIPKGDDIRAGQGFQGRAMKTPSPHPSPRTGEGVRAAMVNALQELQSASGKELSALMPSILDKAFKGDL